MLQCKFIRKKAQKKNQTERALFVSLTDLLKQKDDNEDIPFTKNRLIDYKANYDELEEINDNLFEGVTKLGDVDAEKEENINRLIEHSNDFKKQSESLLNSMKVISNDIDILQNMIPKKLEKFKKRNSVRSVSISGKLTMKKITLKDEVEKSDLKYILDEKYKEENLTVKRSFSLMRPKHESGEINRLLGSRAVMNTLSQVHNISLRKITHEYIEKLMLSDVYKKFEVDNLDETRTCLPAFRDPKNSINLWEIFKENIGKDLSKITMPVYSKEPITILQKFGEFIEYLHLLKTANNTDDPHLRLTYVAAILYILYSNTLNRLKQPFNSLFGETYEYIKDDVKCLFEQVSNHPPVLAFYCQSDNYTISGEFWLKSYLSITSFEFYAIGSFRVHLKKYKEDFVFERPATSLHNYIFGTMFFWIKGSMKCESLTLKNKLEIIFRPKGWSSKHDYEVNGTVKDSNNNTVYTLFGKWNSYLNATDVKSKKEIEIIRKSAPVPKYEEQYFFSAFSITMNHLNLFHVRETAPTDSRFRPDLRAYEYGDFTLAAFEKNRLEENQRSRREILKNKGKELKPYWFEVTINEKKKEVFSKYKGGYFECREKNKWPADLYDLFND